MTTIETHQQQATDLVVRAKELRITNAEEYETAVGVGRQLRDIKSQILEYWDGTDSEPGLVKKAHAAWKALTSRRAEMVDPIEGAISKVAASIASWDREQERLRQEAQRKADEEAARQRQEEIAAELALAKQQGASPAERREMRKAAEAMAVQSVTVAAPEKPKGVSVPKTWKSRLRRYPPDAHLELIKHVGRLLSSRSIPEQQLGRTLAGMIPFDESRATSISKPWKGTVSVPGVEFYEDYSVRFGK